MQLAPWRRWTTHATSLLRNAPSKRRDATTTRCLHCHSKATQQHLMMTASRGTQTPQWYGALLSRAQSSVSSTTSSHGALYARAWHPPWHVSAEESFKRSGCRYKAEFGNIHGKECCTLTSLREAPVLSDEAAFSVSEVEKARHNLRARAMEIQEQYLGGSTK